METGNEVEWTSENNYHFRMSAFRDRLLDFYAKNPRFIVPSTRMHEVIAQVESGLNDLSISRPAERLRWGIPVPDDPSQTIYVWLDALINYLTRTNYLFRKESLQTHGQEDTSGWPADIHVVGKDIIRYDQVPLAPYSLGLLKRKAFMEFTGLRFSWPSIFHSPARYSHTLIGLLDIRKCPRVEATLSTPSLPSSVLALTHCDISSH